MHQRTRAILHIDLDAFYASIEQRDHPEYRGKPVIVLGLVRVEVLKEASERFQSTANSALDCLFTHLTIPVCSQKGGEYFCLGFLPLIFLNQLITVASFPMK